MKAWPYPRFFAHRGGGTLAPENTLAAMEKGREAGYRAVEFDVKLSADGVAVLMHDATLGRTTSGRGRVEEMTYDQLAREDAGSWHGPAFAGERIPRFTEVAQWLIAHEMLANVEIKPCAGREGETGQLVGCLCRDLWLGQPVQPLVSSFSLEALAAARSVAPGLTLGLLVKDFEESHLAIVEQLGCASLHCQHSGVDQARLDALHSRGLRVLVYTVNELARAELLLSMGVDGLFTDQLEDMKGVFGDQIRY